MNDRELLERAAKAAGCTLEWYGVPAGDPDCAEGEYPMADGRPWSPLTDDGDALRLAVRLGLAVSVEYQVGSTSVLWGPPMGSVRWSHSDGGADAATRRAIVRAAAAIGEQHG